MIKLKRTIFKVKTWVFYLTDPPLQEVGQFKPWQIQQAQPLLLSWAFSQKTLREVETKRSNRKEQYSKLKHWFSILLTHHYRRWANLSHGKYNKHSQCCSHRLFHQKTLREIETK
jgi:hypothetical protein